MARSNIELAAKLGQGIASLFAPQDNTQRMKYLLGASQVAENNANIEKLRAEAALGNQEYDSRARFTPQVIEAAKAGDPRARAIVGAAALSLGTGAHDIAKGFGWFEGQDMLRDAQDEGTARVGFALGGQHAAMDHALTGSGLARLFEEQRTTEREKNAVARYGHDASASARRYAADRSYEAAVHGHNSRLYHDGSGGLVNAAGELKHQGIPRPGRSGSSSGPKAGEPGGPITPNVVKMVADEIYSGLSIDRDAEVEPGAIHDAAAWALRRAEETGDLAGAIVAAIQRLNVQPGIPAVDGIFRDTPAQPARVTAPWRTVRSSSRPTVRIAPPPAAAPPPGTGLEGLSPEDIELLKLYGGL